MKRSEHKTNTDAVLAFLSDGPKHAEDVGAHFWPDKVGYGPPRGGPSSVYVAAARFLGRLRAKGLVRQNDERHWELTKTGNEYLGDLLAERIKTHE